MWYPIDCYFVSQSLFLARVAAFNFDGKEVTPTVSRVRFSHVAILTVPPFLVLLLLRLVPRTGFGHTDPVCHL